MLQLVQTRSLTVAIAVAGAHGFQIAKSRLHSSDGCLLFSHAECGGEHAMWLLYHLLGADPCSPQRRASKTFVASHEFKATGTRAAPPNRARQLRWMASRIVATSIRAQWAAAETAAVLADGASTSLSFYATAMAWGVCRICAGALRLSRPANRGCYVFVL